MSHRPVRSSLRICSDFRLCLEQPLSSECLSGLPIPAFPWSLLSHSLFHMLSNPHSQFPTQSTYVNRFSRSCTGPCIAFTHRHIQTGLQKFLSLQQSSVHEVFWWEETKPHQFCVMLSYSHIIKTHQDARMDAQHTTWVTTSPHWVLKTGPSNRGRFLSHIQNGTAYINTT